MDKSLVENSVKKLIENIKLPQAYHPLFTTPDSKSIESVEIINVGKELIHFTILRAFNGQQTEDIGKFLRKVVEGMCYRIYRRDRIWTAERFPSLDQDISRVLENNHTDKISISTIKSMVTMLANDYEIPLEQIPFFSHPGFSINKSVEFFTESTSRRSCDTGNWCHIPCVVVEGKKMQLLHVELFERSTEDIDQLLAWIVDCPRIQVHLSQSSASNAPFWKLAKHKDLEELKKESIGLCQKLNIPITSLPSFGESREAYYVSLRNGVFSLGELEDKGIEVYRKTSLDTKEVLYWIMSKAISGIAYSHEQENRIPGQDTRRLRMKKHVDLLGELDPSWAEKQQASYDKQLEKHPFKD